MGDKRGMYQFENWSKIAHNTNSNSIKGMMSKCVKPMNLEQRNLCLLNQHVLKTTPNIRTLHVPTCPTDSSSSFKMIATVLFILDYELCIVNIIV